MSQLQPTDEELAREILRCVNQLNTLLQQAAACELVVNASVNYEPAGLQVRAILYRRIVPNDGSIR